MDDDGLEIPRVESASITRVFDDAARVVEGDLSIGDVPLLNKPQSKSREKTPRVDVLEVNAWFSKREDDISFALTNRVRRSILLLFEQAEACNC